MIDAGRPYLEPHPDLVRLLALFPYIQEYEALANEHGIRDIFQDNGGKLLQLLLNTGLKVAPGQMGADAKDADDHKYELKSVNLDKTSSISTNHHLNLRLLANFRSYEWVIATYRDIYLHEVYVVRAAVLEERYFARWEQRLRDEPIDHLNNPKIQVSHVRQHGTLAWFYVGGRTWRLSRDGDDYFADDGCFLVQATRADQAAGVATKGTWFAQRADGENPERIVGTSPDELPREVILRATGRWGPVGQSS